MKNARCLFSPLRLVLICLMAALGLQTASLAAPVELGRESFEAVPGIGYTTSVAEFDDAALPNSDFFGKFPNDGARTRGVITGGDAANVFMGEDLDTLPGNLAPTQFLTTNAFSIAGKINTSVKILLAAPGTAPSGTVVNGGHQNHYDWDATVANVDFVRVEASVDGGPFNRLIQFSPNTATLNQPLSLDADGDYLGGGATTLNATFQEFDLPITTGNSVQVRVVMHTNATNEYILVDNIRIFGEASATAVPALAGVSGTPLAYTEGDAATVLAGAITVSDTDSANLTSASVAIVANLASSEDVLSATPSGAILAGDISYTAGTGTLTITRNATLADYQAVLRTVKYQNTNVANPSTANRQIRFSVNDGANNSNQPVREVAVTDVVPTQSIPFTDSFETDGRGTRYALDGRFTIVSPAGTFDRAATTGFTNGDGSNGIIGEDTQLDNALNTKAVRYVFNSAGLVNLKVNVRLGATGAVFDANDRITIEASVNGGAYAEVADFRHSSVAVLNTAMALDTNNDDVGDGTALSTTLQDFEFNLPTASSTLGLRILMNSNSLGEKMVLDRVVVTGDLPAPEIAVTETGVGNIPDNTGTFSFGTTTVGTPVTKTFTVTNSGTATLNLSALSLPSGFTSPGFVSSTVAASGGTTTFQVTMSTAAAATPSGTLSFTNNDGNENPYNFAISGTVNLPPATAQSLNGTTNGPQNGAFISWQIIFDVPVSGLSPSNFATVPTGLGGSPAVISVNPPGSPPSTTWNISVSTGTGDGTLGVNLVNDTGISHDVTNVPFTGVVRTIEKTAPTIGIGAPSVSTIVAGAGSVTYTVTYADTNFNASTLANGNITLNTTGTANGTVNVSGSGLTRTVTISSITGVGTLGISIAAGTASDTAGNTAPAAGPSTTFAVTAPVVAIAPNDLMVIAYNSETATADSVALLATANIPDGTTIHLTDRAWPASPATALRPLTALESNIAWVTSGVTAGKIIRIATGQPDATTVGASVTQASFIGTSYGTLSSSINFDPGTGDQLLIYTTADNNPESTPTFIHAFNADNPSGVVATNDDSPFDGWSDDVGPANTTSACRLPPGLTPVLATGDGGSAFGLASYHALLEQDNFIYSGPTSQTTRANWIARITTFTNWSADDTTPYDTQTQGSLNGFLGYLIGTPAAPTVTLSASPTSIAESPGSSNFSTVTATLSSTASTDTTVTLTASGTATGGGTDYLLASPTITIFANQLTRTTTVTEVPDILDEDNETVILDIASVSGGDGATESGSQQVTVTITDDDPVPSLSINDMSQTEGNSGTVNLNFTVTLTPASGKTVTVDYSTANNTATAGSDYTATSGTLTFTPGQTTKTVTIAVVGDNTSESNETFFVNVTNVTGAVVTDAQGLGTITNDDVATPPTITSVSPASGPIAGGTTVVITGTGFTGASAVNFGTTPATGFTVNSPTQITATLPAGTGGIFDISVVTGTGTGTGSGLFYYFTTTGGTPAMAASKVDLYTPNGAGKVLPGAPIQYRTLIANTGAGDATGVDFADAIPANTTLVPGSVNVSPLAEDNSYATIVNTQLAAGNPTVLSGPVVTSATKVTDNDREFLADTFTISAFDATSANGGSVVMVTSGPNMGSFTYVPAAGFVGVDSFTYTLRDDGTDSTASNADDLTGIGTVVITVNDANTGLAGTQKVWYIDNSYAGANGTENGTSARPFNALSDVSGGSGPDLDGDTIYLRTGSSAYTGGITLLANQTLWGENEALVLNTITLQTAGTDPVITNAAGDGVTVAGGNTLKGFTASNASGFNIANTSATSVGTLTISNVVISGSGGIFRAASGGVLNVVLDSASTTGTAGTGIDINNCTGSWSANAGSISGVTGLDVNIQLGSANITYAGSITSSAGGSISVAGRTGGTVTFSGLVNITGGTGVNLATNTGSTINFTGGLTVSTGGNAAFTATGGGTVNVTGATNTLTTTTGTALNVASTTIGASGLNFRSISSNGATNGIVLNNTGSSGGLTVTGTSSAGTGGTIQSCTSHGISLTSTSAVRLSWMNVTNNLGSGISGGTINGFLIDRLAISGNGNDAATDESGINLTEVTGSAFAGANPTGITNCTITNNNEFEVQITNTSGTLTDFRLTSNTISSNGLPINGNATSPHGNLVNFLALGTASMTLTASGGTYTGNWNPASPPATITATALHVDHSGTSGTMTADISSASFTSNNVAVNVSNANGGNLVFDLHDNPVVTGSRSHALNLFVAANSTGSVLGKFRNNVVGTAGVAGSASQLGFGIRVQNEGVNTTLPVTLLISGNTVQETAGFNLVNINAGIAGQASTKPLNATITANTLRNSAARAITIQQNNATNPTSAGTIAVSISANTFSGIIGQAGDGTEIRLRKLDANGGVFNVTQADLNTLASSNGLTTSDITVGGTVSFNQALPPQPLLFAENLPDIDSPRTAPDSGILLHDSKTAPEAKTAVLTSQTAPKPVLAEKALTNENLQKLIAEAKARWIASGLTSEQKAALEALRIEISDLNELHLGQAAGDLIQISRTAAGNAWFVDETPSDDSEFAVRGQRSDSQSPISNFQSSIFNSVEGVDLLTTLLHEMGHRLGLPDTYALRDRSSIMYGYLTRGERRLPAPNQARGAVLSTDDNTQRFLGATINIGTLPAGKSVTIVGTVLVNDPANTQLISSQGTVSGGNFTSVLTDDPAFAGTTNPTTTPVERPDAAVVSITRVVGNPNSSAQVMWQMVFDQPVSNLVAANFALANTGLTAPTFAGIVPLTAEPATTWNISVNTGTGSGTLGLNLANDSGSLSHDITNLPFIGGVYTIDKIAPVFTSITRQTPSAQNTNADTLVFRATFSEAVTGVNGADFTVSGTTATISSVTGTGPYDLTLSGGDLASLNGTVSLALAGAQNIADTAGNPLPATAPATNQTFIVDNTAPTVAITSTTGNPAANAVIPVTVQFSETVTGFDLTDITVAGGSKGNFVAVDGDTYTFDLTPTGPGVTVTADVAGGAAQDAAGNNNTAATQFTRSIVDAVSIAATTATAAEGGATGLYTFTRGASTGDLTVSFQLDAGSTATAATDFNLTSSGTLTFNTGTGAGTLVIPNGSLTATVTLTALTESPNAAEAAETARLNVVAASGYVVGASPNATVTITENSFLVTTTNNSGTGSLRQAVLNANSIAGTDTITFSDGTGGTVNFTDSTAETITLTSGQVELTTSMTVQGTGAAVLTVSGGGTSRVFKVSAGTSTLSGLTVTGGNGIDGGIGSGAGGGIYQQFATLTLRDCVVSGNTATSSGGGIFSSDPGGGLTLIRCTVSGNSANSGGGLFFFGPAGRVMTIVSSTISGNTSTGTGGGVGLVDTDTTIINSTISGNTAGSHGGGIHRDGSIGALLVLSSVTVTGNRCDMNPDVTVGKGGGISLTFANTETLRNTIIAGNFRGASPSTTPSDIESISAPQTINTADNNVIGDAGTAGGIANGTGGNIVGNAGTGTLAIANVLNTTLASNGGPTQSHALVGGSPALNAGSSSFLPADTFDLDGDLNTTEVIDVDQRGTGFTRAIGTVDIGAFELQKSVSIGNLAAISEGNSGTTNFVFTITRTGGTSGDVNMTYTVSGAAVNGTDFVGGTLPTGTATITSGNATTTVTIPVSGDTTVEPNEAFTVNLSAPDNGYVIAGAPATSTINNDDAATVSIAKITDGAEANAPTNGKFRVTQTAASSTGTTVAYTVTGTATSGTDFTALSGSVIIPAGSTTADIDVTVLNDGTTLEPTETVILTVNTVTSVNNVTLGTPNAATMNLSDDDTATVTIARINDGAETPTSALFRVTQTAQATVDTVITYTTGGTATSGSDYTAPTGSVTIIAGQTTADITVAITNDAIVEATETLSLTLTGFTARDADVSLGATLTASADITDNDTATVTIAAITQAAEPGTNGQFRVTQTAVSSTDTTVTYAVTGTATSGSDFTALSGSVTILAGQTTADFAVAITNDSVVEATETVIATLNGFSARDADISLGATLAATVNITDNDTATVTLAKITDGVEAAVPTNAVFRVTQTNPASVDTVVTYSVGGTATSTFDYTAPSGFVTILAGNTTADITVPVLNENVVEATETVSLTLNGFTVRDPEVTLGATLTASANITDDDTSFITLAKVAADRNEGTGGASTAFTFSATLSNPVQGGFSIAYTTNDGTALAGSDYTDNDNTLTFTGTASESKTITVSVTHDGTNELDETFTVALGAITGTTLGSSLSIAGSPQTGDIRNDDALTISINATDADADENAVGLLAIGIYRVSRNGVIGNTTVQLAIDASSSAAAADWTQIGATFASRAPGSTGTIVIPNGSTFVDFSLTPSADLHAEAAETVRVNVTAAAGYTIGSPANATVTIGQNDFLVINTNNAGEGTLRQAVLNANALVGDDTITFSDGTGGSVNFTDATADTITLSGGELTLASDVTIAGTGANLLILQNTQAASGTSRVFNITNGLVRLRGLSITGGNATTDGGGIQIAAATNVTLVGCSVSGNSTTALGGGISSAAFNLSIVSSTISGNSAAGVNTAGGIHTTGITFNLVNSTISGNSSTSATGNNVGGILGNGTMINCTVTNNSVANPDPALAGGVGGGFTISNSIIAGNVANTTRPDVGGFFTSNGGNIIGNVGTATGFTATNDLTGTLVAPINPLLGPLANNGGPTQTHALLAGSPALNAGLNAQLPADTFDLDGDLNTTEPIPFDQRGTGFLRTVGTVDSGAFEVPKSVSILADAASAAEGTGAGSTAFNFTVSRTGDTTGTVTLNYTVSGAAVNAADFAGGLLAGTFTIPDGSASGTLAINVRRDTTVETNEAFTVTLSNPSNGYIVLVSTAGSTILNDDAATVTVAKANDGMETNTPVNGVFRITQSAESSVDSVLSYTVGGGTAISGTDFTPLSGTATIPAGSTSVDVSVPVLNDPLVELTETVSITLTGITTTNNVSLGTTLNAALDITDDDSATVTLAKINDGAEPAANGLFRVTQTAASSTNTVVTYTVGGTAISGTDFTALSGIVTILAGNTTADISVPVLNEALVEGTETVIATLTGFTARDPDVSLGATLAATADITDNDSATVTLAKINDGAEPGTNGLFRVTQTAPSSTDTVVTYAVTGTATSGTDFTALSGSVTITAGSLTADISVPVIDENLVESTETVIATLTGFTARDPDVSLGATVAATANIADNDTATVTLAKINDGVEAAVPTNALFRVTQTNSASVDTVVTYTVGGTATSGSDFTALSGSVTILAGNTTADISVAVLNENVVEATETVSLTLNGFTARDPEVTLGATLTASANITDSDTSVITLAAVSADKNEGTGGASTAFTFSATLSNPVQGGFTIAYTTSDGTALAASDYTDNDGTLAFTGTAAESKTITVSVTHDGTNEIDEAFTVALGSITGTTLGASLSTAGSPQTGTIRNDDAVTISIAATDANADENSAGTGTYRVTRNGVLGTTTVQLAIDASSTALATDWTQTGVTLASRAPGSTGTIVIPAGNTFVDITLTPSADLHAEAAETVRLNVTADAAYVIGSPANATVTIGQNDFVVINTNDAGEGTLRQAVLNANALFGNPTITFAGVFADATVPDVINLNGEIPLIATQTIAGPGADKLTVQNVAAASSTSRIFNDATNGSLIVVRGMKMTGGNATTSGGAILMTNSATMRIEHCAIVGNSGTFGGAIATAAGGACTLINTLIANNTATTGGGGGVSGSANFTLINCTISGNTTPSGAAFTGGGIMIGGGTTTITQCTITNNAGNNGAGGLSQQGGTVSVSNSLIAANVSNTTVPDVSGAFTSGGGNVIGNVGTGIGFTGINDLAGTGASPVNPLLGPLQDNGGPTLTHMVLNGSPAINNGRIANLPADTFDVDGDLNVAEALPFDQRGDPNLRQRGPAPDAGAFEAFAFEPTITASPTINEDTQSTSGLVISRNTADGDLTTHYQITGITGGTLYQNNGTTAIAANDYITLAQGAAGLKFTPSLNLNNTTTPLFGFTIQAAVGNTAPDLRGATVSTTLSVTPVNDAPTVVAPGIPDQTVTAGTPVVVALGAHFADVDLDTLTFTVTGNTDATKATATLTGGTHVTLVALAFGQTDVTITADDSAGGTVTDTFRVFARTVEPLALGFPLTTNPPGTGGNPYQVNTQTAAFDFDVQIRNTTAAAINGIRLKVDLSMYDALPLLQRPRLVNFSSPVGQVPAYVDHPYPVAIGDTVTMRLTFFVSSRVLPVNFAPGLIAERYPFAFNVPGPMPAVPFVDATIQLNNGGSIVLTWPSVVGQWYRIYYSDTLAPNSWLPSATPLRAESNQTQWIDTGAPFTNAPPGAARFYRVSPITPP